MESGRAFYSGLPEIDLFAPATAQPVVPPGGEGLRVFDVSNPRAPDVMAFIDLPCGSHTATGVPDPANRARTRSCREMSERIGRPGKKPRLGLDRLPDPLAPIEVVQYGGVDLGTAAERGPREPHRHDYHELIWTRSGDVTQLLDGKRLSVEPGTLTLIGRGQVHVFEHARGFHGAVVRFGELLLHAGPSARAHPGWMLSARGERVVAVPAGDVPRLESTVAILAAEAQRPADACSIDVQRHLLATLLLWLERWYDATQIEQSAPDDAAVRLHRRFMRLLERDFARHHDAGHYADALAVPTATLSRALSDVAGKGTKELITDRVMLEAARLLSFSDLSVNQVAFSTGFDDQLYFSRAFKRHHGAPPSAYRGRVRGG